MRHPHCQIGLYVSIASLHGIFKKNYGVTGKLISHKSSIDFSLTTFGCGVRWMLCKAFQITFHEHCIQVQGLQLNGGQPLLKSAEPGGEELAQHICSVAQQQNASPAEIWAALSCLQHASDNKDRVCALSLEDHNKIWQLFHTRMPVLTRMS